MPVLPVFIPMASIRGLSTDASALDEALCTALGVEPRQVTLFAFVHRIQHFSFPFLKILEEVGMSKKSKPKWMMIKILKEK